MNKEVVALLEDKDALDVLRNRYKIETVRFQQGLIFVQGVLDGQSKNQAYAEAFGIDKTKARQVSSQFHRGKWIQALIAYLRPEEDSLYFGEIKSIISVGMRIVKDPRSSPREVTEAMKALQPYIKAENNRLEVDVNITDNTGASIVTQLQDKIALLASHGKMVDEAGEIIDVEFIE